MLKYISRNGYFGTFSKGNFMGYEHYDLTIRRNDTKEMVYHATYHDDMTITELKKHVDEFPEFLERLCNISKNIGK